MTAFVTSTHVYAEEALSDVWPEAMPLMLDNHTESGVLSKDDLSPDRERYELLEKSGTTRLYTMRIQTVSALTGYTTGALVGYCLMLINRDLDYALNIATCSVIYVRPEERKNGGAVDFVRWIISELGRGRVSVDAVTFGSVTGRTDWSRTLLRLGFVQAETKFVKRLER